VFFDGQDEAGLCSGLLVEKRIQPAYEGRLGVCKMCRK